MVNLGIAVAKFNADVTDLMLSKAREHADFLGAKIVKEYSVPGTFDLPFATKKLLENKEIEAVVVLGAVIEGETGHDQLVALTTAKKLMELGIEFNKPIGNGISGPKMTRAQAIARAESYAKRAVEAAVKLAKLK